MSRISILTSLLFLTACSSNPLEKTPPVYDEPGAAFAVSYEAQIQTLNACYKSARDRYSYYKTEIIYEVSVSAKGETKEVRVVSNKNSDPEFESCLVSTIKKWKFPVHDPPKSYKVTQSLRFEPESH